MLAVGLTFSARMHYPMPVTAQGGAMANPITCGTLHRLAVPLE
jgi:hypothetical protein